MLIINDTQLRIIDSLILLGEERNSHSKITMREIADKAGIKRQNIYKNHFNDVNDIINTIHYVIDKECQEKTAKFILSNNKNLITFIAQDILPILYERRRWLKVLYNTSIDPDWNFFLHRQYLPLLKTYLEPRIEQKCAKLEISPDLLHNLILENILSLISSWLTCENPESPSIFREKFLALSSLSLKNLLDEN